MKKWYFITALSFLAGCSSSQKATTEAASSGYRPYNAQAVNRYIDGLINQLLDDNETSALNFETALLLDSNADAIRLSLAEENLFRGRYDRSMQEIQTALGHDPSDQDALELLAELHIRQHNFDRAILALEKTCRLYPANIDAHYRLITIYEIQGKVQDAANHYVALLDIVGPNTLLSMKLGELYMRSRSYDKAVTVYYQARGSDPNNADILSALAQAYRLTKNLPKALETYETLAELQDDNFAVHANVGQLSIQSGNYEKAVRAFNKADELSPNNFEFHRAIGFALGQLNRNTEAVQHLERAAALNSNDVLTLNILAPIYQALKRLDKSDSTFERILALEPDNEGILNNYSYSLAERGIKLDQAKRMIEKALLKAPANPHFLDTMGWVYYMLGQYEQALIYVKRSYDQNSGSVEVCDHMGDIYVKLHYPKEARMYWDRALRIEPGNTLIKKKIEALHLN